MIFTCVIIGIVFQGLIYERHTHYISDPATDHAVSAEDQNLVITVPADGLAPNGARPSADTVLTTKIDIISQSLLTVMKDVWGGIFSGGKCWNYHTGTLAIFSIHCNWFEDRVPLDFISWRDLEHVDPLWPSDAI